jgi:hypothetical protein
MSCVYVINWRIKFVNFQFCWFRPHQGSMYWEGMFSISNFWNSIFHVVLELHLVIILIIIFCSLKTLLLFTDFLHNMTPFSITACFLWNRVFLEKLTSFQQVKKFPHISWNLEVHYCIHKCPPPVPIQSISPGLRLPVLTFCNKIYFFKLLAARPTPKPEVYEIVSCLWLLIQCIHSYPSYWRPFLHLQPEDAPYLGDRDPLITDSIKIEWLCYGMLLYGYISLSR